MVGLLQYLFLKNGGPRSLAFKTATSFSTISNLRSVTRGSALVPQQYLASCYLTYENMQHEFHTLGWTDFKFWEIKDLFWISTLVLAETWNHNQF